MIEYGIDSAYVAGVSTEVAAASEQQSGGIKQISQAITQMDQVTQ